MFKCDIENCLECSEKNNNLRCLKCKNGYEPFNNLCIEKECEIGKNEKCFSCRKEEGRKNECQTCNDRYFISEEKATVCSKCSINNCKKCGILSGKEICYECDDTFKSIKVKMEILNHANVMKVWALRMDYVLKKEIV